MAETKQLSGPEHEQPYEARPGIKVSRSSFNIAWLAELGVTDPKLIMDVGSYDLGDSIRFKRAFPGARVVSFEADPGRNAIIEKYYEEFGIEHNFCAVSSVSGAVEWFPSACRHANLNEDSGPQGSMYRHTDLYRNTFSHVHQQSTPIPVQSVRLDKFLEGMPDPDLLHVDVEGAELDVVLGLGERSARVVYVETLDVMLNGACFNRVGGTNELHTIMDARGYSLVLNTGVDRLYVRK